MAKKEDVSTNEGGPRDFEESLTRLEEIVHEMEGGELGLEKMIARFEEGQTLLKFCNEKLNEVEKRIEVLVKKGDGVQAEAFEEATETDASDAPEELF